MRGVIVNISLKVVIIKVNGVIMSTENMAKSNLVDLLYNGKY